MTDADSLSSSAGPSAHPLQTTSLDGGDHSPMKTYEEIKAKERQDLQKRVDNMVYRMRLDFPELTPADIPRHHPRWSEALHHSKGLFSDTEWHLFGRDLVAAARKRRTKRLEREAFETAWFRWRLLNWSAMLWRAAPAEEDDIDDDDDDDAGVVYALEDELVSDLQFRLEAIHIETPDVEPVNVETADINIVEAKSVETKSVDAKTATTWSHLWARRSVAFLAVVFLLVVGYLVFHRSNSGVAPASKPPHPSPDLFPPLLPAESLYKTMDSESLKLDPAVTLPASPTVAPVVNPPENKTVPDPPQHAGHKAKVPTSATQTTLASTSRHPSKERQDTCPFQKPIVASFSGTGTDVCLLDDRPLVIGEALSFVAPFDLSADWPSPLRYFFLDPPHRHLDMFAIYDLDVWVFLACFVLLLGDALITKRPWCLGQELRLSSQLMTCTCVFMRLFIWAEVYVYLEYGIGPLMLPDWLVFL